MSQLTTPLYAVENFVPSKTDELLWWLATSEKELIKNCVVDRNRYRIVGMSVRLPGFLQRLHGLIFSPPLLTMCFCM